jgi:hypothetical protein
MSSKVAGLSPADASMRLVEWLTYYQNKAEELLNTDLGIKTVREDLISGFIANRRLTPRDNQRLAIFVRLMALGEQALQVPIGKGSNSTEKLEPMVKEAEGLWAEFEKL